MIPLNDLKAWSTRGWAIFPCHHIADGACSCGDRNCNSPGKHPRTFNGVKAATTDMNQIRAWVEQYPDANWALATGEASGVWVLDLDSKSDKNGADSLKDWIEQSHARMFETHTVATGGGGWHYYWAGSGFKNRTNVLAGVDVRGDGGYVLLPGSNHISGSLYRVARDVDPKAADERLVELVRRSVVRLDRSSETSGSILDPIPEGERDDTLFRMACSLRRKLHDDREAIELLVLERARASGFSEKDALRKVEQAFQQDHSDRDFAVPFEGSTDDLYVDVAGALAGGLRTIEPDAGSARTDGLFLMYSGKVNVLTGDPESGKTLIALAMIVDTLERGGSAAVIDLDHNGTVETLSRLQAFGSDLSVLSDRSRFRLAIPESREEYMGLVADVSEWAPSIVLVDSVGELGALFGANLNKDEDYAPLNRRAIQPFATAGSAVIAVDHMAKNDASRRFGAAGSVRKKAAVNGVMYEVQLVGEGFTRSRGGRARLRLKKDRPGGIKDRSPAERDALAAEFVLAPPGLGLPATWEFQPGLSETDRVQARAEARTSNARDAIIGYLSDNDTASNADLRSLLSSVGVSNSNAQTDVLGRLELEGVIECEIRGRSKNYSLVA